jgi:hypothetical protein
MRRISAAASMLAVATIAAHAQGPQPTHQDEVKACGVAAMTDYNKANFALMQQGTPLMSVEATIAQRRLEEEFCLRFVRCVLTDQLLFLPTTVGAMTWGVSFLQEGWHVVYAQQWLAYFGRGEPVQQRIGRFPRQDIRNIPGGAVGSLPGSERGLFADPHLSAV